MELVKSIKNTIIISLIISMTLSMSLGCSSEKENNHSLVGEDTSLADSFMNEEMQKEEGLTLVALKNLLETSTSIEVKNIDNQTIGKISTGENINEVVGDIFDYQAMDSYNYSPNEDVIATISFSFASNEPIYGLIKDKFIYIEGYYFVSENNKIQQIINYFKINNEEEPVG